MKIDRLTPMVCAGILLLSTACIDGNYDLTDIDTTARINVNDLVVPINIDNVQLKSIIDVNENDPNAKIQIVDGAYAYVQSGDFTTGNVTVSPVIITSPKSSTLDLNLPISLPQVSGALPEPISVSLPLPQQMTEYRFVAHNISDDICALEKVTGKCDVGIAIKVSGLENLRATYKFDNLCLMLPQGMEVSNISGGEYDAASHQLIINSPATSSPQIKLAFTASALNLTPDQFDETTHSIAVEGMVGIVSGDLTVALSELKADQPVSALGLKVEYTFGQMAVESVDGVLQYSIDNVNVPEINITGIPDVLAQAGTNLMLTNPQLYLSVNNPLYVCGAYAQTGFDITAYHGKDAQKYSIDKPYFTIAAKEVNKYCFSPQMPASVDAEYSGCEHVPFASLSRVLSGDGLPDKLKVDLVDPNVPRQHISQFLLGHDYGNIHGDYKFVAPLQFDGGSQIIYSDKIDDWSSDDLDKLTITRLDVNFVISTDIPVAIDFTGYPLDKKGNRMAGVTISGANIPANAQNQNMKISVTGEIKDLDGIEFEAKAAPQDGGATLAPNMTIRLSDIRPCVSGYYQTEL